MLGRKDRGRLQTHESFPCEFILPCSMEGQLPSFEKEMDLARSLARKAGGAALRRRGREIGFESKQDDSPVTTADRESEQIIASGLEEAFPDDGLVGEEGASKKSRNGRRWIIDP